MCYSLLFALAFVLGVSVFVRVLVGVRIYSLHLPLKCMLTPHNQPSSCGTLGMRFVLFWSIFTEMYRIPTYHHCFCALRLQGASVLPLWLWVLLFDFQLIGSHVPSPCPPRFSQSGAPSNFFLGTSYRQLRFTG